MVSDDLRHKDECPIPPLTSLGAHPDAHRVQPDAHPPPLDAQPLPIKHGRDIGTQQEGDNGLWLYLSTSMK